MNFRRSKTALFVGAAFTSLMFPNGLLANDSSVEAQFILPKVGAVFEVEREIFGMKERSVFHVIATGPDFVIYYEGDLGSKKKIDPESLTVDFSGIYPESCMDEMPNLENRAKLSSLWPLSEGHQTEFETNQFSATYSVKAISILAHKNRKIPVHWVEGETMDEGFKTSFAVALEPGYAMALSAKWGRHVEMHRYEAATEEGITAQIVKGQYKLSPDWNLDDLGRCRTLFE